MADSGQGPPRTDPERYLAELEQVGWRLGLDRMRALCAALRNPERSFRSLHVVGTNGKSSVALMAAALLEAAGLRTGACVSPHVYRWRERIRLGGAEIDADRFAAAVGAVAEAVPAVEAELGEEERVTQFEAAIAASFVALRDAGVEVAVVEAGLGGRLDATNVIRSSATALTSVALDHTDWLGPTVEQIAAEKLAVLEPGTTLVVGRLEPGAATLARAAAAETGAELVVAPAPDPAALPERFGPYLRRNAAVALELAATVSPRLPAETARAALERVPLAGRLELIGGEPPMLVDVAHNAEAAAALAEALEDLAAGRPRVACLSLLADKDAEGIVAALAPALDAVVCTAAELGPAMGRPGARVREPETLARLFEAAGVPAVAIEDPPAALLRARALAAERKGVAICAGSNYLLRYAWTVRRDQSCCR